ncbi:disulfide bond formation protein B [Neptunomonas phycophila]|uniref:Disulfide bond formation protein B n=1 Tax=Neptunomonas phycophila TaxID=1572645 RepID=A0ABT9EXF9_9GAMM|nr:disulfide bond formation protein B [Neptunomonas phycophila]MDP2523729.1 disulfide bond formation protein B [Neptunomonas phycophila]
MTRLPLFWMLIFVVCAAMEGIALYYQYALDYGPCVLCAQIRAFIFLIMIASLLGLLAGKYRPVRVFATVLGLLGSIGMMERSYQTFGIERGFIDGSCSLDGGFPAALPLNEWLPSIFEPWESCGYTPDLLWGITMAEGLIVMAAALIAVFVLGLPSAFSQPKRRFF